jgi:hypothetical protein
VNEALAAIHRGDVTKAVLIFEQPAARVEADGMT